MADYTCHLCGERCGMMGHLDLKTDTYTCQKKEPTRTKLTSKYVKLTENYGEFEAGTIFAVKYKAEDSYRVHIAYGESLYVPQSIVEEVKVYYDPAT